MWDVGSNLRICDTLIADQLTAGGTLASVLAAIGVGISFH